MLRRKSQGLSEPASKNAHSNIPSLQPSEVLERPRLNAELAAIAASSGKSREKLDEEARQCLKEMAATPSRFGVDMAVAASRYIYTRAFDEEVEFAPGDVERIRQLVADRPVAFTATHKSHIDAFFSFSLFNDLNLPPAHSFGGINMKLPVIGTLWKNAGTIFLRRSFHDDPVYKAVFKNYIDYLGEKRYPLLWALEGTRSRTGKLMPPRYGMINYVASAYVREHSPDLVLMPISISFDQVPEVADYDALQAGGTKRPESASWLMQYISGLNNPHGKIHVRFGNGVALSDIVDIHNASDINERDVQKIAFELAVDVNSVTPVTVNALITYVMLSHGHQSLTLEELGNELDAVCRLVYLMSLPTTTDVEAIDQKVIEHALRQLAAHGVVEINEEGLEAVYAIAAQAGRKAAYYRNGMIHFFTTSAIAELALLSITEPCDNAIELIREEALRTRDLLKFEFFFKGSTEFLQTMESELDLRTPGWREVIIQGEDAVRDLLRDQDMIVGHGTLRPFLEAYQLVAEALLLLAEDTQLDDKALNTRCLMLGKQRVLQQRIHCEESVSANYFANAINIARARGLMEHSDQLHNRRQQLFDELGILVARTRVLASLAEAKRLNTLAKSTQQNIP